MAAKQALYLRIPVSAFTAENRALSSAGGCHIRRIWYNGCEAGIIPAPSRWRPKGAKTPLRRGERKSEMRVEQIQIQIEKNGAFKITDKTAVLTAYLQDSGRECRIKERPAVIICPGGGYEFCSFREGEPVALELLSKGYQVFVLDYSVAPDSFPTALLELAGAVAMVRMKAREWKVIPEKVAVMGFSAGGHLAASLAVFWNQEFLAALVKGQVQYPRGDGFRRRKTVFSESSLEEISLLLRPDRLLLSYPVITFGEYAHRGSFDVLLGGRKGEEREQFLDLLSLEKQVGSQVPPVFLWHTFTDGTVPVENTLLFAGALRKAGVSAEIHIFPEGRHGIALADERTDKETDDGRGSCDVECCHPWVELAERFLDRWRKE